VLPDRIGRLSEVTVEVLTVDNVIPYLLRRKLIDKRAIVEGDLEIVDASRRNQSLKIVRRNGRSYFFKQAGAEPEARLTIGREAWFYSYCQQCAATAPLLDFLARIHFWDEARGLIVLDHVGGRSLWSHYADAARRSFPSEAGEPLGRQLATLHRLFRGEVGPDWLAGMGAPPPWILGAHRPTPDMLARLSPAHMRVLELLQQEDILVAGLAALQRRWRPDSLIHNDLKGENILVEEADGNTRVHIIDWELAQLGDPAWDVGAILRDFLSYWLMSVPLSSDLSAEEMLSRAQTPLSGLHPAARAFWEAYSAEAGLVDGVALSDFLLRATQYCAARLVQGAYELCSNQPLPPNMAIAMLQLAANIMADPRDAALHLFGVAVGWRRAIDAASNG
jgi:aminoglycoside phosphotransferase (APT) family kinase protein